MNFPSKGGKTVAKGFALSLVHLRLDVCLELSAFSL